MSSSPSDRSSSSSSGERAPTPGSGCHSSSALRSALEEWHPDPGVGALSPLDDDDDLSEGDEDMHTVMRAAPAFLIAAARDAAPAPVAPPVDDDDDDDQATRMRHFQI